MYAVVGLQPELARALTEIARRTMEAAVTSGEWDVIADQLTRAATAARTTARELAPARPEEVIRGHQ
jgi:hypothetical protein